MKYCPKLFLGDCREVLKKIPYESVDLIFTSPPYSDQRKSTYGGTPPDQYVDWFLPIAAQLFRVLKPTGTFILNIKEKAVNGERHTYVLKLILALKQSGWLWTEEFIWHKKNSYPGKWPNRLRDSWERLLQFNKQRKFAMYQEAVMVPASPSTIRRLQNQKERKTSLQLSKTGSGFSIDIASLKVRDMAYPSNVVHLATTTRNKGHSATFPDDLPRWFIKLFTQEEDMVLDPFMGSGTTNLVARDMGRCSIGIEVKRKYYSQVVKSFA